MKTALTFPILMALLVVGCGSGEEAVTPAEDVGTDSLVDSNVADVPANDTNVEDAADTMIDSGVEVATDSARADTTTDGGADTRIADVAVDTADTNASDTACGGGSYRAGGGCVVCTSCTALEYETAPCTAITDRACTALTACTDRQYESTAATATTNRVCSTLTTCTMAQYESTAPTATTDRVCTPLTTCTMAQYESTAPTSTTNRVCSPITACTNAQYQTAEATATTDRVCAPLTVCTADQYESTAPTPTTNRACSALTVCTDAQYQTVAPTATTNRQCADLTVCTAPAYETTAPTATTNRVCTVATSCQSLHTLKPALGSGAYMVRWPTGAIAPTDVTVYCDMTSDGGGWTLVRRNASATNQIAGNDNLAGTYSAGTPDGTRTQATSFSVPFESAPFTEFRFATGDEVHWLITAKDQAQSGYVNTGACNQQVTIKMSSKYTTAYQVNWCKRTGLAEDPWISIESHGYNGLNPGTNNETHSMLYGENNYAGWLYYTANHQGQNVFVR